jgi:hypothetical protein
MVFWSFAHNLGLTASMSALFSRCRGKRDFGKGGRGKGVQSWVGLKEFSKSTKTWKTRRIVQRKKSIVRLVVFDSKD